LEAEVELDVHPGGEGRVRDEAGDRQVRVDEVDDGRRLVFSWWPADEVGAVSRVELVLVPSETGTRLVVTETACNARASATASVARGWQCRLDVLAQVLAALVRV
jgi:uncharacterized protein YndB with AHSA1/START domain